MKKRKNFYKILNIDRAATPSEIKKAYREAAKRHHPDVSSIGDGKFRQIQEAYETLSDPQRRTTYDRDLRSVEPSGSKDEPSCQGRDAVISIFDHFNRDIFDVKDLWFDLRAPREQLIEIILTPDEARKGGEISLEIPFRKPCPRCMGTGFVWTLICGRCRGEGEEEVEKSVTISIPSGVRDGTTSRIPVHISGATINLLVKVTIGRATTRVEAY